MLGRVYICKNRKSKWAETRPYFIIKDDKEFLWGVPITLLNKTGSLKKVILNGKDHYLIRSKNLLVRISDLSIISEIKNVEF